MAEMFGPGREKLRQRLPCQKLGERRLPPQIRRLEEHEIEDLRQRFARNGPVPIQSGAVGFFINERDWLFFGALIFFFLCHSNAYPSDPWPSSPRFVASTKSWNNPVRNLSRFHLFHAVVPEKAHMARHRRHASIYPQTRSIIRRIRIHSHRINLAHRVRASYRVGTHLGPALPHHFHRGRFIVHRFVVQLGSACISTVHIGGGQRCDRAAADI